MRKHELGERAEDQLDTETEGQKRDRGGTEGQHNATQPWEFAG